MNNALKTIKKDHSDIDAILEKNGIEKNDQLNTDLLKWKNQCLNKKD